MHEALLRSTHTIVDADEFSALPSSERNPLRPDLACPSCRADAYFIREARNGRRACFGARPHGPECELASLITEDGGRVALDETEERINAGDIFLLEPNSTRAIRHLDHDPNGEPGTGSAARYTGKGRGLARTSSMSMNRLLRQLVLRKEFRKSKTTLVLDDNTKGTVRTVCKHTSDVSERDRGKKRVYWGTILYPRVNERGGAWLNTGSKNTLTVVIGEGELNSLLIAKGLEDLEDLSGSYFAFLGTLRMGASGKLLLWAEDLDWIAVRTFEEDAGLN